MTDHTDARLEQTRTSADAFATHIRVAAATAALTTAACVAGEPSSQRWTVRDSAGVEIVESMEPALSTGTLDIGPGLQRLGSDTLEEQTFYRVVGAVRLAGGTLVIADAGSSQLRRYSADGRHLGTAGGAGEGPGEFRGLTWLGRGASDSLLTWDARLARVSVFDASGEHVRSYEPALEQDVVAAQVRASLGSGRLVMTRGASFTPAEGRAGVQRQPVTAWVIGPDGAVESTMGPFEGETVELRSSADGAGVIRTVVPFGPTTIIAAHADRVYASETSSFEIRVYTSEGRLERILRRRHDPMPVREADVTAWIEERLAPLPPVEDIRAGMRASLEAVSPGEFIPPVESMILDSEGSLWVENGRHMDADSVTWSVFDQDGVWQGDARLAAGSRILEIEAGFAVVLFRDELDVESIEVRAIQRAGS